MHLRESRTSKFSGGKCPRTPLGSKSGLRQIYPPVTLKFHLCNNVLKPLIIIIIIIIIITIIITVIVTILETNFNYKEH